MGTHASHPRLIIALAVLAVLVVMLACGSTDDITPEPAVSQAEATQPTATEPAEAADTPAPPTDTPVPPTATPEPPTATPVPPTDTPVPTPAAQYLGDAISDFGYGLAAVSVQDPATPGLFYSEEPGTRLVGVDLIIANTSDEPQSVNPLSAALVDADGFVYNLELASTETQLPTVDLLPGQKVRGLVGFKLPESAVPVAIKWTPGVFSSDSIKASLEEPPDGHTADTAAIDVPAPAIDTPLGQEAQDYGMGITAVTLEDPATAGTFYTARPGTRLVAVEIVVSNIDAESISVNPLYATLVDADGFIYDPELAGRDGQIDALDIGPGEKARGWVAFTIPEDAIPAGVRYSAGVFGDDILQVSLTQ